LHEDGLHAGHGTIDFCYDTHLFSSEESHAIRRSAGNAGTSVNDLILCGVFAALDRWESRCGTNGGEAFLRINMPTSLRDRQVDEIPVCNRMSFAFLTRRRRDCRHVPSLLQSIHEETTLIKRWRLGGQFLEAIRLADKVPGLLPRIMRRRSSFATMIVSNLGDIRRRLSSLSTEEGHLTPGNLRLLSVAAVPPVRPGTHAAACVLTYRQQISLSLRCTPALFPGTVRREFLSLLAEQVLSIAQTAAARPASS
jgi:hypothetical protein